jgi:hypothetical protein
VEDKYSANFTGSNPSYPRFKYDFLFKGVTFFEENESITYYDWIPGNDFVYLTNSYPLMNLILIILIIAIPITFLIDRYVIKPSLEPQKAKRDFSRKKMRRRKARRLSSI